MVGFPIDGQYVDAAGAMVVTVGPRTHPGHWWSVTGGGLD